MTISWRYTPICGLPDGGVDIMQWINDSPRPDEAAETVQQAMRALAMERGNRLYEGRAYTAGTVVWFAVTDKQNYLVQYVLTPSAGSA